MSQNLPRTLFAGRGNGAVAWYRCALPAMYLDQDWIGIAGEPPNVGILAGVGRATASFEDFFNYDVVVLQYQASPAWVSGVRRLQEAGVVVLFEIDDYARSVRKKRDHAIGHQFGAEFIKQFEMVMRVCDGVICSTEYLARRYRSINPRTWVCQNAIDLPRYRFTRPATDTVTLGWAGGTGHREAMEPWLPAIEAVMDARPQTRFMTIGEPFANRLLERFGAERCIALPSAPMETYPAAMASFDIALAPAGRSTFYQGKSDLRWLESSALGIPLVADPNVYPEIEDRVTGFHVATPADVERTLLELVDDAELRTRTGAQAHEHVAASRSMAVCAPAWADVLRNVAELRSSPVALGR
jgi:glycosyltransferase involved in cell wall biosynthesis